ncbi:MAG TPA: dipeptidase [Chloroflexota bacterium]|nr:dipeptidase [Chloroflexota bacterium]
MTSESVRSYARHHASEYRRQLEELLRIPSISTLPEHAEDCERAARWLADRMTAAGLENVEVVRGRGRPLVYADWLHAEGAPTVLVYGHYDVQPVDPPELWISPPFEPEVRDGFIYARGSVDDKGQVMTMVAAADAYLQMEGRLPINVRFLIEGEEESGGEHIKRFLQTDLDRLKADFAHVADSSFFDSATPSIDTGLRGIVYAEIRVRGADHDLHSGEYGGVAPNPFISLARVIAQLRDEHGVVMIPGFYDEVKPPPETVLEDWRSLGVTEEKVARDLHVRRLIGDSDRSVLERQWALPTLDVHGMPGGFTAEGAKTVIPALASAKVSMRIVPDQTADGVWRLFEQAVRRMAPDDVEVTVKLIHGDDPVLVPEKTPEIRAAAAAVREVYGKEPVLIRTGGSIPVVGLFQERLGIPTVLLGFGLPGSNLHAPNERFSVEQFERGIETNALFWGLAATRKFRG